MNEYGAMVEWYWQGKTEVLGEKHYKAWVVDGWMSMEQWWNDTDRGKLKFWEKKRYTASVIDEWMCVEHCWNNTDGGNHSEKKNLSHFRYVYHESDIVRHGINLGFPRPGNGVWPLEPSHGPKGQLCLPVLVTLTLYNAICPQRRLQIGRFVVPKTCFARYKIWKTKRCHISRLSLAIIRIIREHGMWCVSQYICSVTLSTRKLREEGSVHCVACVCAEGDKCDGCGLPTVTINL